MKQLVGCAGRPRTAAARRVEDVGGGWAAKEVGSLAAVVLHGRGEEAGVRARARRGEVCSSGSRCGGGVGGSWRGTGAQRGVQRRTRGWEGGRAGRAEGERADHRQNDIPIFSRRFILFRSRLIQLTLQCPSTRVHPIQPLSSGALFIHQPLTLSFLPPPHE
jgi:hypothetical protein